VFLQRTEFDYSSRCYNKGKLWKRFNNIVSYEFLGIRTGHVTIFSSL